MTVHAAYLAAAGMPGMTGMIRFRQIMEPKPGKTASVVGPCRRRGSVVRSAGAIAGVRVVVSPECR